jgi:hypothetical protein
LKVITPPTNNGRGKPNRLTRPKYIVTQSSDETNATSRMTSRDIIVEWRLHGRSFILGFVAGTPERADLTQIRPGVFRTHRAPMISYPYLFISSDDVFE